MPCSLRASHTANNLIGWSQLLLDHSLTYALARGLPGVVNFLAIALYTRLLEPERYGEYSLVIATVALLDALLIQWLRLGLLRFLPQLKDEPERLLGTLLNVWLLLAAAVAVPVLVALLLLPGLAGLLLGGLLLFLAQGWFELNLELVRTRLQPRTYGQLALGRALLSLGLGALLAWLWGPAGLLLGLAAGTVSSFLLLSQQANWRTAGIGIDRKMLARLLDYGLPLTVTFALGFLVNSSDRFLLGWFLGTGATGLYSAGYDLAQFSITMLLTIVNLAAYPLTVRALEDSGPEAARGQLQQTLFLLLTIGLPATAGLALLAGPVAEVVVGADFTAAAASVIPWISFAALLAGLKAFYVDVGFQLGGDTRLQAWVMLLAAILNIVLNVLFIPRWGLMGAVHSTVVVYVIALLFSLWLVRRSFSLPRLPARAWAPVLATSGMMAGLVLAPNPQGLLALFVTIAGAALLYALLLVLLVPGLRRRLPGL